MNVQLYELQVTSMDSEEYKPAFSPAVYGWQNALELNCLQYIEESDKYIYNRTYNIQLNPRFMGLFTRMTGTEHDADRVSLDILRRPMSIVYYMENEDDLGNSLKSIFPSDLELIYNRILDLRRSIYWIPRHVAVLLGKNPRLGEDSNVGMLSDDVWRIILRIAAE